MNKIKKFFESLGKMAILPLGMYVLFLIISLCQGNPNFFSAQTILMILRRTVYISLVAWAFSITIQAGRWDFAIGAQVLLSAIIGTNLAQMWGLGTIGILALSLLTGVILGAIYGIVYVLLRVPSRVLSLGILLVYEAVSTIVFNSKGARLSGDGATVLGTEPWLFVIGAVMLIIHYVVMYKTKFGFDLRSLGNGQEVAVNMGVKEDKNAFIAYTFAGLFLGVAGAVYISMNGIIEVTQNMSSTSIFFNCIMPVTMGTYLSRYGKTSFAIIFSSMAMSILIYGLITIGVSTQMQNVCQGFFIIMFMTFTQNQQRASDFFSRRRLQKAFAEGKLLF